MPDGGTQLEVFPTDLRMRRVDPARDMRRFYEIIVGLAGYLALQGGEERGSGSWPFPAVT